MTPIYQRTDNDCFRCCIASLLDWPYEAVPDFMEGTITTVSQERRALLDHWFGSHGLVLLRLPLPVAVPLQARALIALSQPRVNYVFAGRTRKGVGHAVIGLDSEVVHDPARPSQLICEPFETGTFWSFFIGLA